MKRLIFLLLFSSMLFGCTKMVTSEGKVIEPDSFIDLETVTEDSNGTIYKDKHSGVLYLVSGSRMTAIMEADGTCLTWDEWVKRGGLNEAGNERTH